MYVKGDEISYHIDNSEQSYGLQIQASGTPFLHSVSNF